MTISPLVASGTFLLSFPTQPIALAAAREARTRGFAVDVRKHAHGDRWHHHARPRVAISVHDLGRYESRLRKVAITFDGTYEGFTPDSPKTL